MTVRCRHSDLLSSLPICMVRGFVSRSKTWFGTVRFFYTALPRNRLLTVCRRIPRLFFAHFPVPEKFLLKKPQWGPFQSLKDFPVQGNLNGFFRHVAEQRNDVLEVFGIRMDVHGRLVLPFFNESQDIGIVHVLVQVVGDIAGFSTAFFHQFPCCSDKLVPGSCFDDAFGSDFIMAVNNLTSGRVRGGGRSVTSLLGRSGSYSTS